MLKDQSITRIQKFLIYLAAFLIMLNIGTVYTHMPGGGHLDGIVTFLPAVLLLGVVVIKRWFNQATAARTVKVVVLIAAYLAICSIICGANMRNTIAQIMFVAILVLYCALIEKGRNPFLLIAYRDIIFIVALISLVFWLFGSILGIISPSSSVISNWGVSGGGSYNTLKSYYHLYFELDRTFIFGGFITSNRSIFVERAFTSFAFSIGWLYELFIENRKSKVRLIIFSLSMISTLSMTGLIIIVVTFMLYYIFNGTNQRILNFVRVIFIPVIVFVAWFSINFLLETKFSMGHSGISRISDFRNGFVAWKYKPLFGYGFGNSDVIHQQFRTGYSNSVTMILTQGGLAMFLLYLIPFVKGLSVGIKLHNINYSLFVVVIILSFSFTAIAFTDMMIYLLIFFVYGRELINVTRAST